MYVCFVLVPPPSPCFVCVCVCGGGGGDFDPAFEQPTPELIGRFSEPLCRVRIFWS